MALTKCFDCKADDSDQARFCPRCGAPTSATRWMRHQIDKTPPDETAWENVLEEMVFVHVLLLVTGAAVLVALLWNAWPAFAPWRSMLIGYAVGTSWIGVLGAGILLTLVRVARLLARIEVTGRQITRFAAMFQGNAVPWDRRKPRTGEG